MKYNPYSQETLVLYEEASYICKDTYSPDKKCAVCKYVDAIRCKTSCLQEKYDIIDLKILQPLDIDNYIETNDTCIMPESKCYKCPDTKCSICLLETLLKDKNIKFVKKEQLDD